MRTPDYSTQFRRDFGKVEARGKNISQIEKVMGLLLEGVTLPPAYKDHQLKGKWKQYRELHIESDWLLVYKIVGNIVVFARTGTHSDIFGK